MDCQHPPTTPCPASACERHRDTGAEGVNIKLHGVNGSWSTPPKDSMAECPWVHLPPLPAGNRGLWPCCPAAQCLLPTAPSHTPAPPYGFSTSNPRKLSHAHTCTQPCTQTHIHTRTRTRTRTHTHAHTHTQKHTRAHTHKYTHTHLLAVSHDCCRDGTQDINAREAHNAVRVLRWGCSRGDCCVSNWLDSAAMAMAPGGLGWAGNAQTKLYSSHLQTLRGVGIKYQAHASALLCTSLPAITHPNHNSVPVVSFNSPAGPWGC